MKKFIIGIITAFMLFGALSVSAFAYENEEYYKGAKKGEVINVFNWGEYISESYEDGLIDVNKEF